VKILVTGGTGYLGRSFISACRERYEFQKFSLQTDTLEDLRLNQIDTVLHCAALVHQKKKIPYETYYQTNVCYTLNLAKKAKANGVKHFIFVSSIAVYGANHVLVSEDTMCEPTTHYARTKREAEVELLKLGDKDFTISIVRPPLVYGAGAPGNMATLMRLVKNMRVLPLAGIKNKRTFVYIDNLIHMIDMVIQKRKVGIFLAADDDSISTTRLIKLIAKIQGKKTLLVNLPLFETLLKLILPNVCESIFGSLELNNQASKISLGCSNPVDLEEGICRAIHNTMSHN